MVHSACYLIIGMPLFLCKWGDRYSKLWKLPDALVYGFLFGASVPCAIAIINGDFTSGGYVGVIFYTGMYGLYTAWAVLNVRKKLLKEEIDA
ncbi:hypothetical protein ACFPK9_03955 [Rubritalea spongiae]|uniref:Uncharacterized protein n=1 Tax=Rubritalea spongiae TaxID=430797 RepID=A0ABW5E5V7_9BACT